MYKSPYEMKNNKKSMLKSNVHSCNTKYFYRQACQKINGCDTYLLPFDTHSLKYVSRAEWGYMHSDAQTAFAGKVMSDFTSENISTYNTKWNKWEEGFPILYLNFSLL